MTIMASPSLHGRACGVPAEARRAAEECAEFSEGVRELPDERQPDVSHEGANDRRALVAID